MSKDEVKVGNTYEQHVNGVRSLFTVNEIRSSERGAPFVGKRLLPDGRVVRGTAITAELSRVTR